MARLEQSAPRIAVLLASIVLATAACAGAIPTTSPTAGGVGASPSATARTGGMLSIAYQGDIQYLDPQLAYDVVSQPASRLMFEPLLGYDAGTKVVPLLAQAMPAVTADGLRYTFKLRKGVSFVKRDGSVLREAVAEDVLKSFDRLLNPNLKPNPSPVASAFYANISGANEVISGKAKITSGIKVLDPSTVEFTLLKPDRTFLNVMASSFASVIPTELAALDATKFSADPVGTGPFYLKQYTKGQKAVFLRNAHYWQPGKPALDSVDFRVGVDDTSALNQVKAGQLDILGDPIPAGSQVQTVNDPQYKDQVRSLVLVDTNYLSMDTTSKTTPLSNVKVRQALNYAIDKQKLVDLLHGIAVVADCIFPPPMQGFDPSCKPYNYDPAKAKAMLAEAGHASGFSTKLYTDTTETSVTVAQGIQQDLAQVGVQVEVVTQSFDVLITTITTPGAASMIYIGWFQDYPDQSDFIDPILSCATAGKGGSNIAHYCNKEVDALAAAAKGEQDEQKRVAQYQEIQRQIMAEAPWVPLVHLSQYTLISKRVGDFAMHPVWLFDIATFSLKQ
jgi:peptide/nickel transport system substrate-binding protein